jgi:heat shock protein HtpX
MQMFKRISLFLITNLLVMMTLSLVLNLLGVRGYLTASGIDYSSLMIFCLVWGMGGAFISLLMSKWMAKMSMGVQIIDPATRDSDLQQLVQTVHNLARSAGLTKMPEVGIYDSPELNAFATGPTKNNSLVAVSTGLIQRMSREELEGVLGHEIAHVANGDMVTMTLVQGVVNAFVMFLARIISFALVNAFRKNDDDDSRASPFVYSLVTMAVEMVLMMFGSMVVAWFSRYREFRADAGGARLAGRESMIKALQKLQRTYEIVDPSSGSPAMNLMKISGHKKGFLHLFSTHPPLEVRIERLSRGV